MADARKILLVGAGSIAPEYVKALRAVGIDKIDVLGRDLGKTQEFAAQHSLGRGLGGGTATLRDIAGNYDGIIIASSILALRELTEICAAEAPETKLLVEKPVVVASRDAEELVRRFPHLRLRVALNRLYFPSIAHVRKILATEAPTSVQFSFVEWVDRIDAAAFEPDALARWGMANSVHVVSTVFDLIGLPAQLNAVVRGRGAVAWHPSGAIFIGSGVSTRDVPFSYHSDWTSAGRWSIRVYTRAGCYVLEPMEEVRFIAKNTVQPTVVLPQEATATKPGFEPMLRAWLDGDDAVAVDLPSFVGHLRALDAIFGYGTRDAD